MERKKQKGFFGFVVDAQKEPDLLDEFLKTVTLEDLVNFFKTYSSYGIDETECRKIWQARKRVCTQYKRNPEELYRIICGGRGY